MYCSHIFLKFTTEKTLIDCWLAYLSSERLHSASDGNRCRDAQPNIRRTSGNPGKDYRKQRDQGHLGKSHRVKWPGFVGAYRAWTPKQRKYMRLIWALCICAVFVWLSLLVGTPFRGSRGCLWYSCLLLVPFPPTGCLVQP